MKKPAPGLRSEILVLYYAVRHRSTPLLPKMIAASSLLYLLSPIDLIPDFIPFAGWLDDLVVVPLLLHLSYRLLPTAVVQESRYRARGQGKRLRRIAWMGLGLLLALMAGIYWYYHHEVAKPRPQLASYTNKQPFYTLFDIRAYSISYIYSGCPPDSYTLTVNLPYDENRSHDRLLLCRYRKPAPGPAGGHLPARIRGPQS